MAKNSRWPHRSHRHLAVPRTTWAAGLLLALGGLALIGCGGDDNDGVADAGRDGGALPQCKPADCAAIPQPVMQICMTGTAVFTCARNIDGKCTWVLPRCSGTGGPDAQADGSPEVGASNDAGAGNDAGSTGALPDVAEDAPAD